MSGYKLKTDGDIEEQQFSEQILDEFPNYEFFWDRFITPWTNRDLLPRTHPMWLQFRNNVPQFIEELCMAHYSVFRDLTFFVKETRMYGNESLRTIYVHFGHAIEMAYLLAVKILIIRRETKLSTDILFAMEDEKSLLKKFKDFIKCEYEQKFQDYEFKQIPIIYTVSGTRRFLKNIVKNKKTLESLTKYFGSLQDYRNRFIHSPLPGTLFFVDTRSGTTTKMAIKKDRLDKYRLWTDITHNTQHNPDDFIPEIALVFEEFKALKQNLNVLWQYYIQELEAIYKTKALQKFLSETKTPV